MDTGSRGFRGGLDGFDGGLEDGVHGVVGGAGGLAGEVVGGAVDEEGDVLGQVERGGDDDHAGEEEDEGVWGCVLASGKVGTGRRRWWWTY